MSRSWLIVPLLILYLFELGGVGFLGPDEPRYASVGREMGRSRDFITPRLDGQPWFEKPPLLYWMMAAGRAVRLPDEWAARLPVALMSAGFLIFFFQTLQREFSTRTAITAATILATSAGWLAYSFVGVTDLPMTATFAAAMLIAIFDTRREQGYLAGALLGLSILAKGFVPVVLFVPMFLIARGKRWTMIAGCAAVAAPWYVLCTARNGPAFWRDFLWKQHVERYFTASLQHVQPFWFYLPVIVAGLFPWTLLLGLLARPKTYSDVRIRFFAGWSVFALLFLSIGQNKLPGYVLPLFPALAVVLAVALEKTGAHLKWWLSASVLMLVALPAIATVLPEALLSGIRKAPIAYTPALPFLAVAGVVWWLAWREQRLPAILIAALAAASGTVYLKIRTFPVLDARVSVRGFWNTNRTQVDQACVDAAVRREWRYGLNYYVGHPLPECVPGDNHTQIGTEGGHLSVVSRPR